MKRILISIILIISLSLFVTLDKARYNSPLLIDSIQTVMTKPLPILLQYLAPQHMLTQLAGWLSENRTPWLKNYLIQYFIQRYQVNMMDAVIEDPKEYPNFNSFFIRQLKAERRPWPKNPNEIASPIDGIVSQIGQIHEDTLVQAKGFSFTIQNLLGGNVSRAEAFKNGSFATFYLSPKDYHRVHMPISGKLKESIYIPGNLFSVNQRTCQHVSNLFARNERLVAFFDTEVGPMAVVLVGAMMVGSIHTVWHAKNKEKSITVESFGGSLRLARGDELGHFQMGSTVILLFAKDKLAWDSSLIEGSPIKLGQPIGVSN